MKNILLIDIDSKIPNLALMKLSAYYRLQGDNVGFNVSNPDVVYASVVFEANKHKVDGLKFYYPDSEIIIGGSGYDLKSKLPEEIENMVPDYSLYPECDYSIGFSSRGCVRNTKTCPFCIVPIKEGYFKRAQHPTSWYNSEFDKIVFLDNNILSDKAWFMSVTNWCIDRKLKVWFTQGLDIRKMDEEIAKQLFRMKVFKGLFFAWDHIEDEEIILNGIQLLKQAGFKKSRLRTEVQFYIYTDSDKEYESALHRCITLKNQGVNSFVMYNIRNKPTQRITNLRRWANKKQLYWSIDIEDYKKSYIRKVKTVVDGGSK